MSPITLLRVLSILALHGARAAESSRAHCPRGLARCAARWRSLLQGAARNRASPQALMATHQLQKLFWGNGPHLHRLLLELSGRGFNYSTCIDGGAGIYVRGAAESGDESLALQFHRIFSSAARHRKRPVRVFGFEPNAGNRVHDIARRTANASFQMSTLLVSSGAARVALYGATNGLQNAFTTNVRLLGHKYYRTAKGAVVSNRTLPATSVDAIVARHALESVDVLKTDTEGCEWEVMVGAAESLRSRRIKVLLVAYEDKWSADTLYGAYPSPTRGVAPSVDAMSSPTLRSVTRHLAGLGYESYLLGSAPVDPASTSAGVQFIPLTGGCWDDSFEIGRDPRAFGLHYTWLDFVAVVRGSPESAMIREIVERSASCAVDEPAHAIYRYDWKKKKKRPGRKLGRAIRRIN